MSRRRLDVEMVRRGLAESRHQAQQLIGAGRVRVSGASATKAGRLVAGGDAVLVVGDGPRFVSRGGDKLDAALDRFDIDVDGRRVIDVGASTGGFTDCCLQRGAAHVVAVDVGRGQLHERLVGDPRVTSVERCNIRTVEDAASLGGVADIVVVDVSFISLSAIVAQLADLVSDDGDVVVLAKPQFEAGRAEASRGRGVIRDPAVWRRVLGEVVDAAQRHDLAIMGAMVSPLHGSSGNTEFLLHLRPGAQPASPTEVHRMLGDAVDAAQALRGGGRR